MACYQCVLPRRDVECCVSVLNEHTFEDVNEFVVEKLAVVWRGEKIGLAQIEGKGFQIEEEQLCLPCKWDDIRCIRAGEEDCILVKKDECYGIYSMFATMKSEDVYKVFCQELIPCIYRRIETFSFCPRILLLYSGRYCCYYDTFTKEFSAMYDSIECISSNMLCCENEQGSHYINLAGKAKLKHISNNWEYCCAGHYDGGMIYRAERRIHMAGNNPRETYLAFHSVIKDEIYTTPRITDIRLVAVQEAWGKYGIYRYRLTKLSFAYKGKQYVLEAKHECWSDEDTEELKCIFTESEA